MRTFAISICLLLCGCLPPVENSAKVVPVVQKDVVPAPNPAVQERLKPVTLALAENKSDAAELGALYLALSDVIKSDSSVMQSTSQVRTANAAAGKVMFGSRLKGKYPGLGQTVDAFLSEYISPNDVPLTDELRAKSVDAFSALAWACMEAAK